MTPAADLRPRRLLILGSTGSIGQGTVDVVEHLREQGAPIEVAGLAAGANATLLLEQKRRLGVAHAALREASDDGAGAIGAGVQFTGASAAEDLVRAVAQPGDLVVAAIVGAAGIPATIAAIECGCDVALANKEALVAAGSIVMPMARDAGIEIIPVDSEHSAILQCMAATRSIDDVKRIVLTASGGPFRTWTAERIFRATVDEALAHPTWRMGRKVTIDSATLMNKALELVEARWLFDLPSDRIEAIVHPESLVHGFVECIDGSVIAQLAPPDMRTAIQLALTWPHRADGCSKRLDWQTLTGLNFEPVDPERFPAIDLARRVIDRGGTSGAIMNAANEVAVEAFLGGRVGFGDIVPLVEAALEGVPSVPSPTIDEIQAADGLAREHVSARLTTPRTTAASRR